MKNKLIKSLCLLFILLACSVYLNAQTTTATITVNAIQLFNVEEGTAPTFAVGDPAAAGELPLITPAGDPTYLQYTVVVATGGTKVVTASCDTVMRDGLRMNIWSGAPTGTGGVGSAIAGGLEVSTTYAANTAVEIIDGITSCATGSGTTQGPAIFYTLTIDESTLADMVTTAVPEVYTITYTMTDG